MRRFVIGDVHGMKGALDALLAAVAPRADDRVIFLGDLVDRGPESAAVVDDVRALGTRVDVRIVMGNHEEMMLSYAHGALDARTWIACGGGPTLAAYAREETGRFERDCAFLLDHTVPFLEDATHLYVHGTADPAFPLARQPSETLRWRRFGDPGPHASGRFLVAGHTIQKSGLPRVLPHAACIDTWVYGDGWLTAFAIDDGTFIQAREDGSVRTLPAPARAAPSRNSEF